jgi:hypothetical protein
MKTLGVTLTTMALALAAATTALASMISSIPITVVGGGGEFASCSLANIGTKPLKAIPPAVNIQVQIFDASGTDITGGNTCGPTLAPGTVCDAFAAPAGFTFAYCKITFSGGKAHARASLKREDGGDNTLVAVPVQ